MMMMVRLGVQPAALAAFDDNAVGVVMGDIDEQSGLAAAAAIGFVTAAFAGRTADGVLDDVCAFGLVF
ncbi:hypothetical protein GCM10011342_13970 [Aquisalinus flavus]|uniref:Uncharacterized protein n=1 Tax=Aquisalinus flavus TaxID=1526572 RepID=A0A8J2V2Q7_9PROT|nr:hypothetical protein GCM10011342_13970 [Aquisalinus flavus]